MVLKYLLQKEAMFCAKAPNWSGTAITKATGGFETIQSFSSEDEEKAEKEA